MQANIKEYDVLKKKWAGRDDIRKILDEKEREIVLYANLIYSAKSIGFNNFGAINTKYLNECFNTLASQDKNISANAFAEVLQSLILRPITKKINEKEIIYVDRVISETANGDIDFISRIHAMQKHLENLKLENKEKDSDIGEKITLISSQLAEIESKKTAYDQLSNEHKELQVVYAKHDAAVAQYHGNSKEFYEKINKLMDAMKKSMNLLMTAHNGMIQLSSIITESIKIQKSSQGNILADLEQNVTSIRHMLYENIVEQTVKTLSDKKISNIVNTLKKVIWKSVFKTEFADNERAAVTGKINDISFDGVNYSDNMEENSKRLAEYLQDQINSIAITEMPPNFENFKPENLRDYSGDAQEKIQILEKNAEQLTIFLKNIDNTLEKYEKYNKKISEKINDCDSVKNKAIGMLTAYNTYYVKISHAKKFTISNNCLELNIYSEIYGYINHQQVDLGNQMMDCFNIVNKAYAEGNGNSADINKTFNDVKSIEIKMEELGKLIDEIQTSNNFGQSHINSWQIYKKTISNIKKLSDEFYLLIQSNQKKWDEEKREIFKKTKLKAKEKGFLEAMVLIEETKKKAKAFETGIIDNIAINKHKLSKEIQQIHSESDAYINKQQKIVDAHAKKIAELDLKRIQLESDIEFKNQKLKKLNEEIKKSETKINNDLDGLRKERDQLRKEIRDLTENKENLANEIDIEDEEKEKEEDLIEIARIRAKEEKVRQTAIDALSSSRTGHNRENFEKQYNDLKTETLQIDEIQKTLWNFKKEAQKNISVIFEQLNQLINNDKVKNTAFICAQQIMSAYTTTFFLLLPDNERMTIYKECKKLLNQHHNDLDTAMRALNEYILDHVRKIYEKTDGEFYFPTHGSIRAFIVNIKGSDNILFELFTKFTNIKSEDLKKIANKHLNDYLKKYDMIVHANLPATSVSRQIAEANSEEDEKDEKEEKVERQYEIKQNITVQVSAVIKLYFETINDLLQKRNKKTLDKVNNTLAALYSCLNGTFDAEVNNKNSLENSAILALYRKNPSRAQFICEMLNLIYGFAAAELPNENKDENKDNNNFDVTNVTNNLLQAISGYSEDDKKIIRDCMMHVSEAKGYIDTDDNVLFMDLNLQDMIGQLLSVSSNDDFPESTRNHLIEVQKKLKDLTKESLVLKNRMNSLLKSVSISDTDKLDAVSKFNDFIKKINITQVNVINQQLGQQKLTTYKQKTINQLKTTLNEYFNSLKSVFEKYQKQLIKLNEDVEKKTDDAKFFHLKLTTLIQHINTSVQQNIEAKTNLNYLIQAHYNIHDLKTFDYELKNVLTIQPMTNTIQGGANNEHLHRFMITVLFILFFYICYLLSRDLSNKKNNICWLEQTPIDNYNDRDVI